jgi:hypothetical protein
VGSESRSILVVDHQRGRARTMSSRYEVSIHNRVRVCSNGNVEGSFKPWSTRSLIVTVDCHEDQLSTWRSCRHSPAEFEYVARYSARRQPPCEFSTHCFLLLAHRAQVILKRLSLCCTRATLLLNGSRRHISARDFSLYTFPWTLGLH